VLYDKSAIYIGISCTQIESPIVARLTRRDQSVEADWVQVNIDTKDTGTNAFLFTVNAAGVLGDGIRFNDTESALEWDEVWDARVARTPQGWSAEVAIPWHAVDFSAKAVQKWGFQVRRYTSTTQEIDEWAFIPRTAAGEVSQYGTLTNLTELQHSSPVSTSPFMIGQVNWYDMGPRGAPIPRPDYNVTGGINFKWHINHGLTLSVAVNPDLAQLEADQLILNLTTFETLFPEKRTFFLQGFDVFQTPMQAFYSRRIGMAPPAPALSVDPAAGERLVVLAPPPTLYGAVKLVGTVGKRLTAGLLSTLTSRSDAQVWTPGSGRTARLAAPLTLYSLLRLRWAIASNTSVGLLASAVDRFEPTQAYPVFPGARGASALCPSGVLVTPGGRCFSDSYLVSADGTWRSASGDYLANGQVMVTSSLNGPPRTLLDGTVIRSGNMAPGGRAYLAKEGGKWLGSLEFVGLARSVDYNDIGYMQRQNHLKLYASIAYRTLTPFLRGRVLETRTHLQYSLRNTVDGLNLWRGTYLGTDWRFANYWNAALELYYYDRRFDDREVGDGTALQRERLVGWDLSVSTDPRRKFSASFYAETLVIFNGFSLNANATLTGQFLPQLQVALMPQGLYTFGEPRFISTGAQPSEYLFGRLQAESLGATLRASYVFTPRLTLQVYSQLFLVAKHYSDFSAYVAGPRVGHQHAAITIEDLKPTSRPQTNPDSSETAFNINVVLRWEFQLGSMVYLLYARSHSPDSVLQDDVGRLNLGALRSGPAIDSLMLKFSYLVK
jgi:hypothetical protein